MIIPQIMNDEAMQEAERLFEEWWQDEGRSKAPFRLGVDEPDERSKAVAKASFMDGYLMNTTSVRDAAEQIADNISKIPSYQDLCAATEAPITPKAAARLVNVARDLHGLIGIATEMGELLDAYKRHIFYGAPLDKVHVGEEIGDLSWYQSLLLNVHGLRQGSVQAANIEKLRKRYPEKFTEEAAMNRDLASERAALDKMVDGILEQDDVA